MQCGPSRPRRLALRCAQPCKRASSEAAHGRIDRCCASPWPVALGAAIQCEGFAGSERVTTGEWAGRGAQPWSVAGGGETGSASTAPRAAGLAAPGHLLVTGLREAHAGAQCNSDGPVRAARRVLSAAVVSCVRGVAGSQAVSKLRLALRRELPSLCPPPPSRLRLQRGRVAGRGLNPNQAGERGSLTSSCSAGRFSAAILGVFGRNACAPQLRTSVLLF